MCKCGNKKCKVAALSAKTAALRAAYDAAPMPSWSYRESKESKAWTRHSRALHAAESECKQRQAILDVGPICPLCRRAVAAYGGEPSAETCMIIGRLNWRSGFVGGQRIPADDNMKVCLGLAWDRLAGVRRPPTRPTTWGGPVTGQPEQDNGV